MIKQSKNRQIKRGHIVPVWEKSSSAFKMFYKTKKDNQYTTETNEFRTIKNEEVQNHLSVWNDFSKTGKIPTENKGIKKDLINMFSEKNEVKNSYIVQKLSIWKQFKVWLKSYLSFS